MPADRGSRTRENRDLPGIAAIVRGLLDFVLVLVDALAGFVRIDRAQARRDFERFAGGQRQGFEANAQLSAAGDFSAALGVGDRALHVGTGGNQDRPFAVMGFAV